MALVNNVVHTPKIAILVGEMMIDHWSLGVITCFQTQPWWWYRMQMWWENAWSVKTPPNPCCVGFPSSKWSFRVLHLKFLVYKPWPVLTVNVSYLLYQVYDMSRFSMKCSVSVCSSCSGYISHMFLVKKCFFRRLASRLFLLQCCGVLGRLTCSSAIPWVLR